MCIRCLHCLIDAGHAHSSRSLLKHDMPGPQPEMQHVSMHNGMKSSQLDEGSFRLQARPAYIKASSCQPFSRQER